MSLWNPNLIHIQETSSREMKLVDQLNRPSPFALHLMPTGKSEPVEQCAILRNEERAETPALPVVKPKQMEKAWKSISTIGKHHGKGWTCAAKTHVAGESTAHHQCWEPARLASDWRTACKARVWALQEPGPRHRGLKTNQTKPACFHLREMK